MSGTLTAQKREHKKKMPLNQLRRDGQIPGTIYGKEMDPINFKVDGLTLKKFLVHSGKVFEVSIDGAGTHLVNIDNIQKDNLGNQVMHIAFHKLKAGEATVVKIPLVLHGDATGHKAGGIINQVLGEVECKGLPKDMPEFIEVDVSALEINGHISLKDISPPSGLEFTHDLEANIVSCSAPKAEIVEEVEVVEGEAVVGEAVGEITPAEDKEEQAS